MSERIEKGKGYFTTEKGRKPNIDNLRYECNTLSVST